MSLPLKSNRTYLVLNCSEANLQVVLGTPENLLWFQSIHTPGRSMKHMAPVMKSALSSLEIRPEDLAGISCVAGPGSFTGTRMVFAHAHGLSLAAGIPMAAISYFDALIRGPGYLLQGPAWIFIHSRRNQFYAMKFALPGLMPLSAPANIDLRRIALLTGKQETGPVHVFGSGVRKNPDYFTSDLWNILPTAWDVPLPSSLLSLAIDADYSFQPSFPEYLRQSEAEENQSLSLRGTRP